MKRFIGVSSAAAATSVSVGASCGVGMGVVVEDEDTWGPKWRGRRIIGRVGGAEGSEVVNVEGASESGDSARVRGRKLVLRRLEEKVGIVAEVEEVSVDIFKGCLEVKSGVAGREEEEVRLRKQVER